MPDIGQIVFYDVRYVYDEQLNVVADTNAGAEFRPGGVMNVYRAALFPTATVAASAYSAAPASFWRQAQYRGEEGGDRVDGRPTRAESQRRAIAHELGHGVEFATGALSEFEQAVGWVRVGGELRLYDIQAQGVKAAIEGRRSRPAAARITRRTGTPARIASSR